MEYGLRRAGPLPFEGTGCHLHEGFVGEQIGYENRQNGQAGACHHIVGLGSGRNPVFQVRQPDSQRLQLRLRHREHEWQQIFIPRAAEGEQRTYAESRSEQRQNNPPEGATGELPSISAASSSSRGIPFMKLDRMKKIEAWAEIRINMTPTGCCADEA